MGRAIISFPHNSIFLLPFCNWNAIITTYCCEGDALHMDIGTAIKEIRNKCLLSQAVFAHEIGVSFSPGSRWENGKTVPGFKTLKKIKEFCNINGIDFNVDKYISK